VALESTTVQYTVRIFAGTGGTTNPSGTQTVAPNTQLTVTAIPYSGYEFDHWVYKGQDVGSVNPLTFLIDRNAITITALFKEVVTPPPNGETPPNGVWPIVKTEQVFDNERLAPGLFIEAIKQREKQVDTSLVLGGQIEYSVKLESSILTGCTFSIVWNNEVLDSKEYFLWEPHGKIKTGVVDIPLSKILSINVLAIVLTHVPATNNVVLANVYVTFGYSSEPTIDPPWKADWIEWLKIYGPWITLGITGLAVLYMMMRPAMPIIVIPGGKRARARVAHPRSLSDG